jgi:hypothetical protein
VREGGWVKIWTCGVGLGEEKEEVRTGARMLPRARRRPCTWASRWASCSMEDWVGWSGTLCDWGDQRGSEERINGTTEWLDRGSRVEKTILTIVLRGWSTLLGRMVRREHGRGRGRAQLWRAQRLKRGLLCQCHENQRKGLTASHYVTI